MSSEFTSKMEQDLLYVEALIKLATSHKLACLEVQSIKITPNYDLVKQEGDVAASVEAQAIANKLYDVSDDKLLDDPFAGLPEAMEAVKGQVEKLNEKI